MDTQRTEGDLDFNSSRHRRIVTSTSVNHSPLPLHVSSRVDDDVIDDVTVTSYRDTTPRRIHNYTLAIFCLSLLGLC